MSDDTLRAALDEATALIETGENRALAVDGPVGHFRDELDDREWRRLWLALGKVRAALAASATDEAAHVWYEDHGVATGGNVPPRRAASAPDEGRCLHCHESASGVCTLHNGSAALAPATCDCDTIPRRLRDRRADRCVAADRMIRRLLRRIMARFVRVPFRDAMPDDEAIGA